MDEVSVDCRYLCVQAGRILSRETAFMFSRCVRSQADFRMGDLSSIKEMNYVDQWSENVNIDYF